MQAAIFGKTLKRPWIYGYFGKCEEQWETVSREKEENVWVNSSCCGLGQIPAVDWSKMKMEASMD